MYHRGNRELQAAFGSTALADRLVEHIRRSHLNEADIEFIEQRPYFFLATASPDGHPDCSFKGGWPGFVKVLNPKSILFPDFDGNGMFKSLGNIKANPKVGMLFISMDDQPRRLRVNGTATVETDSPHLSQFDGAQAIIRITPIDIFQNCPRYIPDLKHNSPSKYLPQADKEPLEPAWKGYEHFKDVVPERKR